MVLIIYFRLKWKSMSNKHLSFDDRLMIEENNKLQNVLTKAHEEIDRLKSQINNKNDDNKYIRKIN